LNHRRTRLLPPLLAAPTLLAVPTLLAALAVLAVSAPLPARAQRPAGGDPCAADHAAFVTAQAPFTDRIQPPSGRPLSGQPPGGRPAAAAPQGYFAAMAARYPDPDTLAQAIHADLQREARNREQLSAAVVRLKDCRFGIVRAIRQQVLAHAMPRPMARHRLMANRDKMLQELGMAERTWTAMGKRDQEFQDAAKSLQALPPRLVQPPGTGPRQVPAITTTPAATRQVQIAATETIPQKRRGLQGLIATTRSEMPAAFDLDANPS